MVWLYDALPPTRSITVNISVVQPVTVVRDLCVWIDSELSMRQHVSRVARTCVSPASALIVDNSAAMSLHDSSQPRTTWTTATLFFQRQHWHHCRQFSLVSRRTTSPIYSHRSPTFTHACHCVPPQMESLSTAY